MKDRKALILLCSITLPLLASIGHYEVISFLNHERYVSALGFILGFSGAFMLISAGLAALFSYNSKFSAAWVSVWIVTAISAAFALSAKHVAERSHELAKHRHLIEITSWKSGPGKNVEFKLERSQLFPGKIPAFQNPITGIQFTGSIANNSSEQIVGAIIDYTVLNTKVNQSILTHRLFLQFKPKVYQTAKVDISGFYAHSHMAYVSVDLGNAYQQLGNDAGWTYNIVGLVPESLYMKIEAWDDLGVEELLEQRQR